MKITDILDITTLHRPNTPEVYKEAVSKLREIAELYPHIKTGLSLVTFLGTDNEVKGATYTLEKLSQWMEE